EVREDLAGGGEDLFALRGGVVDRVQGEGGGGFEEFFGILEEVEGPLGGGEDFRGADAAVVVGVDEFEGVRVEFEPPYRAGERDPELLVELVEGEEVGAVVEADLVEAAGAEEAPDVAGGGGGGCGHGGMLRQVGKKDEGRRM